MDPETAINDAFNEGNVNDVSRLLRAHPDLLRHEDGTDRWMGAAAMDGNLSMLQALVGLGLDVNDPKDRENPDDPDDDFYQPEGCIVDAASEGRLEVVRWLLEHGAKVNYVVHGKPRCLPLERAATDGHIDVVEALVEHGADIHAIWQGSNAVTLAEDYGQFAVRDYLRSHGARTMREITPPDYVRSHKRFIKQTKEERGPLGEWKFEILGDPLVALHLIPANEKYAEHTIFTVGLSDHPLPHGKNEHACTELRCMLPATWPLSDDALGDPQWNWPVEWLKRLASELRAAERWPDEPVVFMNGDPPAPLAPNTQLCGWLCLKSLTESVHAPDYRWIDIHSLIPLYREEIALVRKEGHEELVNRFEARDVRVHIDPHRPNMAMTK